MFDGGISAVLRDLARFGAMILAAGVSLTGKQVVPASWIQDTITGGPDSRAAFAGGPVDNGLPGGMYRNQFWVPYPDRDVLLCMPQDAWKFFATVRASDAIAAWQVSRVAPAARTTSRSPACDDDVGWCWLEVEQLDQR